MHDDKTTRRRETIVIAFVAFLVGAGAFVLLMLSAGFLISVLPVLAVLVFLCVLHYLIWGRKMVRDLARQDRGFANWLDEVDRDNGHEEDEVLHAERTFPRSPADHPGPRPGSPSARPG